MPKVGSPARPKSKNRLTEKQQKFLRNYARTLDKVLSAEQAGYAHPSIIASKFTTDLHMAPRIRRIEEIAADRGQFTQAEILYQIKSMATMSLDDFIDQDTGDVRALNKITHRGKLCFQGIKQKSVFDREGNIIHTETELKLTDKQRALDMATKISGLYRQEAGNVKVSIDINAFTCPQKLRSDGVSDKLNDIEQRAAQVAEEHVQSHSSNNGSGNGNGKH